MSSVPTWIACAMLGLLSAGCGHADAGSDIAPATPASTPADPRSSLPTQISGNEVATMAERELEAENPGLAPGHLHCPALKFVLGASVRCLRTVTLTEGRVVRVRGTVTVTSLASGGRLHVVTDDEAEEFGVAGDYLAADVRKRSSAWGDRVTRVRCPYLPGTVGATVSCRLSVGGARRDVRVQVTSVDPEEYRTTYAITAG